MKYFWASINFLILSQDVFETEKLFYFKNTPLLALYIWFMLFQTPDTYIIIKIFLQENLMKDRGCVVGPQFHSCHGTAYTRPVEHQASMDKEGLLVSPLAEKPLAADGFQVRVKSFSSGVWSLAGYSCTNVTQ